METGKVSAGHLTYLRQALDLARLSPPKPTNFRVGALLLNASTNTVIATGYTLECPGNTHAEQCCFIKFSQAHNIPEDQLADVLPEHTILYTTMEPCAKRLSGNVSCSERILRLGETGKGIRKVVVGVREPEKFVGENEGRRKLEDAGIEVLLVKGLEEEILEVATAGHVPASDR
ncbi:27f600bf-16d4-42ff-b9a8-1a206dae1d8d [Sclerotinia trifoliorum]|uniref:27f600bf-16d4-42ff-b9a8-1a206dae1d8d n=1 Tax=Sclerotinia trifoliorum TaxID=28548 RepID=A0A8H2ZPJ0_9HELO|nr:27f600bf-16d4-42ff-b9a8-1a206dae1d8d [Sclerotinia trifoliorum]